MTIWGMLRRYSQLTRAHSAPLEVIPAAVGAAVPATDALSWTVGLWGMYGMLYHLAGYGMNSYSDWRNGFDRADPNKSHHPLNRGTLSKEWAKRVIIGLLGLTFLYGVGLSLYFGSIRAAGIVFIGFLSGVLYNEFGKYMPHKWMPIAVAHSTVFLVPYIALGGSVTTGAGPLMLAYVFLWVVFQIAVSGELKDLNRDESNLLKRFGCAHRDGFLMIPSRVADVAVVIKSFSVFFVILIAYQETWATFHMFSTIALVAVASFITSTTLQTQNITRPQIIQRVTNIEIATAFAFVAATVPFTSGLFPVAVAIGSIVWTSVFNYIEWGSFLSPQV